MARKICKAFITVILLGYLVGCSDGVTDTDVPQKYIEILSIEDNHASAHKVGLDTHFNNIWISDRITLKAVLPSHFALALDNTTVTIDATDFNTVKEISYNINSPDLPFVMLAPWHRINITREPILYKGISSDSLITGLRVEELRFKGPESVQFNSSLHLESERPQPNRFLQHNIYKTTKQLNERYLMGDRITYALVTDSLESSLHINRFYREFQIFKRSSTGIDKFEPVARFKPNLPYSRINFGRGLMGMVQNRYVFFSSNNGTLYMQDLVQNETTLIDEHLKTSYHSWYSYSIAENGIYYTSSGKIKFYDIAKERSKIIFAPDTYISNVSLHYDTATGNVIILNKKDIIENNRYVGDAVTCSIYDPSTGSVAELFTKTYSTGTALISNFVKVNGTFFTTISVKQ